MNIVKTGMLWIDSDDISMHDLQRLHESYTYQHPREPDQKFSTITYAKDRVGIPAGDLEKARHLLPDIEKVDDRTCSEPFKTPVKLTGLTLRDYQETALSEALDYISNEGGTSFNLSGSPGSGKSVMLSAIIAELGVRTLIIAHLSMLTTQLQKEIEEFTDAKVTVLNSDNSELGDINIATSQFIAQHPEIWYQIKKHIGLIAVDEAESIGSETTLRILQRAHAKYRIAITATFTRSVDGRTPALRDMIGHKVITLQNNDLLKPTVIAVKCDEAFTPPKNKNLYKRALISFFKRNTSIDQKINIIVVASLKKKRQVLIATDLTDFQNRYAENLVALGYSVAVVNGSTSKKDRDKILEQYNKGKIDVLLGFGVLNAGLSIPRISTIIRVSTPGNLEKLEQLIGRGRREYDGKEGMWFIDLIFTGFRYASEKRIAFYNKQARKEGWKYALTSWEKFYEKLINS